jgi:hypothetical protein
MAQSYRTLSSAAVLNTTGVAAGSYGSGSLVPVITVSADGRITAVSTSAVSGASVTVSATQPATTVSGSLWLDSDEIKLSAYLGGNWVDISGSAGYTGSASTTVGYTGSTGVGYTGSSGINGYTGSASITIGYTGSVGVGYTGSGSTEGKLYTMSILFGGS